MAANIEGIHGLPYRTWPDQAWNEDIKGKPLNEGDPFGGFCTHSSILFLPWHRPYMALFEVCVSMQNVFCH